MRYILDTTPTITMPLKAKNPIIDELLSNYTYGKTWNISYAAETNVIMIGDAVKVECGDGETVVNVTDTGVYISGQDFPATMRGFITFLESIQYVEGDSTFYIESARITKKPLIGFRCVHLCIFPETDLHYLKKYVRSCAVAKFSHIILEFWGMLTLDCLKELAWPFAYSKDEVSVIVAEANALGVEIIPMFNHLGHASACRELNGKHVVLDQNPTLEYMFESYGWTWNIRKQTVRELLAKVRAELIDVCGEGRYFHIGCDEAYAYGHSVENAMEMAAFVNTVSEELNANVRRAIMWHDMLLSSVDVDGYVATSSKEVSTMLLDHISKKIIIADWQYWCKEGNWKSAQLLKENGYDVVCCSWEDIQNISSAISTVTSDELYGFIHTTWHTLHKGFREMVYAGVLAYGTDKEDLDDIHRFYCAAVARKVMPPYSQYEKCGWSEKMTGPAL